MRLGAALLALALAAPPTGALAQSGPPLLVLEATIPLGDVRGRIDHLAIDLKRKRLYVAELGNDSLGVVDRAARRVVRTLGDFSEPQGVLHEPATDTVYVANAGDGSVQLLRGDDFAPIGRIDLGADADNIRLDAQRGRVLVGYGKGALAVLDPSALTKVGDIRLSAHPESFQIVDDGVHAFVNLPNAREIALVDLTSGMARTLPNGPLRGNFPMAVDNASHRVLVVFRNPSTLVALTAADGQFVRWGPAVTLTIYSPIRSAIAFMSAAAMAVSTSQRSMRAATCVSPGSRP